MDNILKRTVILLIMAVSTAGCNNLVDKSNEDELKQICEEETQQTCTDEFCLCAKDNDSSKIITAKVENASEFSNVVEVKFIVEETDTNERDGITRRFVEIARSDWKDGGFTIELPKMSAPNQLFPIDYGGRGAITINVQPTLTISNENAKVKEGYFVGVDEDGNVVACFLLRENVDNMDVSSAWFTYADSDVTISGYSKLEGAANPRPGYGDYNRFEFITTYSIDWKKGWNVWFFSSFRTITDNTSLTTVRHTTTHNCGLKWYGSIPYDYHISPCIPAR